MPFAELAVVDLLIYSLAMETEQIGNATLGQMGRQRDQLQNAHSNIDVTLDVARQAGAILSDM